LDVRVAEVVEEREGGSDVGTVVPGAAAAVQDDFAVFGKLGDGGLEVLQALRTVARARVDGAGNVFAVAPEGVEADMEDRGLGGEMISELFRLDEREIGCGGADERCGEGEGEGAHR